MRTLSFADNYFYTQFEFEIQLHPVTGKVKYNFSGEQFIQLLTINVQNTWFGDNYLLSDRKLN